MALIPESPRLRLPESPRLRCTSRVSVDAVEVVFELGATLQHRLPRQLQTVPHLPADNKQFCCRPSAWTPLGGGASHQIFRRDSFKGFLGAFLPQENPQKDGYQI